jgi:hypothetical protein
LELEKVCQGSRAEKSSAGAGPLLQITKKEFTIIFTAVPLHQSETVAMSKRLIIADTDSDDDVDQSASKKDSPSRIQPCPPPSDPHGGVTIFSQVLLLERSRTMRRKMLAHKQFK